jgi:hypothetical protein
MLLRKEALDVVSHASTEDPRYSLQGILIEPDGSAVATDGHRLAKFTPAAVPPGEDFPKVEGLDAAALDELKAFILPVDAAKAIRKAVPKVKHVEVLGYIGLDVPQTNANGCAVLAVTDLSSPQVFRPAKIEGNFPRYQNIIPTDEPDFTVTLNAKYLQDACALAQKVSGPGRTPAAVKLQFYKPAEIKPRGTHGTIEEIAKPVVLLSKSGNGALTVVIMPWGQS